MADDQLSTDVLIVTSKSPCGKATKSDRLLALFVIRGESLLNLRHGWPNTLVMGFFWALGVCVIGYLGQMTNIFQVSLFACATVGTAWPIVFTRIVEKANKPDDEQPATQEELA